MFFHHQGGVAFLAFLAGLLQMAFCKDLCKRAPKTLAGLIVQLSLGPWGQGSDGEGGACI